MKVSHKSLAFPVDPKVRKRATNEGATPSDGEKVIDLGKSTQSSSSSSDNSQATLITKFGKPMNYTKVDSFYSPASLSASRKSRNKLDRVAKGFALSIVHEQTNDCISELQ